MSSQTVNQPAGDAVPVLIIERLPLDAPAIPYLRRMMRYLNEGVRLIWSVDPADRTVTVHRQNGPPSVYHDHQTLTGEDVIPALQCKVADLLLTADGNAPGTKPKLRPSSRDSGRLRARRAKR